MRVTVALVLSVLAIAGAVLYASESQRKVAEENYHEAIIARQLATDMLPRENTLHEFVAQGGPGRSSPSTRSTAARTRPSRGRARCPPTATRSSPPSTARPPRSAAGTRSRKASLAHATGSRRRIDGWTPARERAIEDFLAANRDYQRSLDARRVEELQAAALVPVKLIFALSVVFGAIALALVLRRRRTVAAAAPLETEHDDVERRYADGQARFGEAMQVAENQAEGHELLVRHLEAGAPEATITVLIRNNSGDRLEPALPLPADSPLAEPLEHAKPRGCLAVRLSRPVDQGPSSDEIITCEVCGRQPGESTCQPLLVGGEVIGSVLTSGRRPAEAERRRIHDSVTQAAPVLANLRNLALAELRAATDALTGLPEPARDRRPPQAAARAGRPLDARRCRRSSSTSTTSRRSTTPTATSAATRCSPPSAR